MSSGKLVDRLMLGPWRRRRRMHRLLRELDRRDAGWRPSRRDARQLTRRVVAGMLAIGLACGIGFALAHKQFGLTITASGFARQTPLGTPPEVSHGLGSFKFSMHQPLDDSSPVAYDPCRPIEFEVNEELAPPGGSRLIHDSVFRIEAATGLDFRFRGMTRRLPESAHGRMPHRPVVIAWTTPGVVTALAGRTAGIGGSQAESDSYTGRLRYVTGLVALDAPQLRQVLHRPNGAAQVRAIVVHELGHLVGLDHVDDPNELMHLDNVGLLELGPGDREGLAALGSGRCFN